jgi:hypothetical protein
VLPSGRRGDGATVYRVTPPWSVPRKRFSHEFEAYTMIFKLEHLVKRTCPILDENDSPKWRILFAYVMAAYYGLSLANIVSVYAEKINWSKR